VVPLDGSAATRLVYPRPDFSPATGKINGVTISFEKPILTKEDRKKLGAAQRASQD
jgi:hypothetical protein